MVVSKSLVLHTATPNIFGHDRRADRAAEMILAFDTFNRLPQHVRAVDVGAIRQDGRLLSLADVGEYFVLTGYAEGHVYAEDLRAVAERKRATDRDLERARRLGSYLASLHQPVEAPGATYVRTVRDLLGSGEGIFGIVDGYPAAAEQPGKERLKAIEQSCLEWRWRLKPLTRALAPYSRRLPPFQRAVRRRRRAHSARRQPRLRRRSGR